MQDRAKDIIKNMQVRIYLIRYCALIIRVPGIRESEDWLHLHLHNTRVGYQNLSKLLLILLIVHEYIVPGIKYIRTLGVYSSICIVPHVILAR